MDDESIWNGEMNQEGDLEDLDWDAKHAWEHALEDGWARDQASDKDFEELSDWE